MADPNGDNPLFDNKVSSILIGVGSAVFVVTMYRLLVMCLCNQHHHMITTNQRETQQEQQAARRRQHPAQPMNSVSQLIPAHKYEKKTEAGDGDDDEGKDVTCAVCLGDFEEGEELRTLPECMHSFHVPCIDMWLCSHSSCPVCRADATPLSALGSGDQLNEHHNIGVMQIAIVQNGSERG